MKKIKVGQLWEVEGRLYLVIAVQPNMIIIQNNNTKKYSAIKPEDLTKQELIQDVK